jgi:hypothetical protein
MSDRPLFIPLRACWFDAFACGEKTEEWRRHGPRWNANVCRVGRPVVLSRGYSGARLHAVIEATRLAWAEDPAVVELYGEALCFVMALRDIQAVSEVASARSSMAGPQ